MQIGILITLNALGALHTMIVRPFKDLKDNISTSIAELAFTIACSTLPFIELKMGANTAGDVLIYSLMGATVLNGVVSAVFLVPTLRELYKKYCNKKRRRVTNISETI